MKKTIILANCLVVIFLLGAIGTKAQAAVSEVKVSDFKLLQQPNRILIKWIVDKKSETKYFEVEKSVDGKKFKTVAYVMGADPMQKDGDCFLCFDKLTNQPTKTYYRLKQINENGNIQYSQIKILALK